MIRRLSLAIVLVALALAGCSAKTQPSPQTSPQTDVAAPGLPLLKVGETFTADLLGDGQAAVTVAAVSTTAGAGSPLVVTVKILLSKAGAPITGGPQNFVFRDTTGTLYRARTDGAAYGPELAAVNLTATGQATDGKVVFDVPAEMIAGGHIQLVTGKLVHAVWQL